MLYDYNKIVYENESKYETDNNNCINSLLETFLNYFDKYTRDILELVKDYLSSEEFLYFVIEYCFHSKKEYINILYTLLNNYNYNFYDEIRFITTVFRDEPNAETLKLYEASPNIKRIILRDGRLLIDSTLGQFFMTSTKEYFKNNSQISNYLAKNNSNHKCHSSSIDIINMLSSGKLITALIPAEFIGTYYHTVIQDENLNIIDVAHGTVYTEETFFRLYKGLKIVSITDKEDIEFEINHAKKEGTLTSLNYFDALLIALHKQSILDEQKMHNI